MTIARTLPASCDALLRRPCGVDPRDEAAVAWIRVAAYYRWVDRGRLHGYDVDDWLAAERDHARLQEGPCSAVDDEADEQAQVVAIRTPPYASFAHSMNLVARILDPAGVTVAEVFLSNAGQYSLEVRETGGRRSSAWTTLAEQLASPDFGLGVANELVWTSADRGTRPSVRLADRVAELTSGACRVEYDTAGLAVCLEQLLHRRRAEPSLPLSEFPAAPASFLQSGS